MIKHYYYFSEKNILTGQSLNMNNWDALRIGNDSSFAIEPSKEEWEQNCYRSDQYRILAKKIIENVDPEYKNWISFGIGKGILEWNIMDLDRLISVCGTDYAQESVKILKTYFEGRSETFCFDMLSYGDYGKLQSYDVAVMCRLSTEFDKSRWKMIFDAMYETSIKEIVFIPTEILTFKIAVNEMFSHFCHLLNGKKDVFCGYMYSRREFEGMFGRWNIKTFMNNDITMWVLSRSIAI